MTNASESHHTFITTAPYFNYGEQDYIIQYYIIILSSYTIILSNTLSNHLIMING